MQSAQLHHIILMKYPGSVKAASGMRSLILISKASILRKFIEKYGEVTITQVVFEEIKAKESF